MKNDYKKNLFLAFIALLCFAQAKAQTYVSVYTDDFESYTRGTNLLSVGYDVWEGTAQVTNEAGNGHNGSSQFAKSDNSKIDFTLLRSVYPLETGTYRVTCATKYTSGVNHNPLNVRRLNASGVDQGNSYFNNGVAQGTGAWQEWNSGDFTVASGGEGVRIQHYRYGKVHTLLVDDVKLQISSGIAWNGSVSTDWHTAGNWDGGAVPTATDHVLVPAVTNMPIISTGDVEVVSLEIANGAKLKVEGTNTLKVSGQLTGDQTGHVEMMSGTSLIASRIAGKSHIIHRQTRFANGRYSAVGAPVKWSQVSSLGNPVYSYDETKMYNSTVDNASNNDGFDRFIAQTTATDTLKVGAGYFSASTDLMTFTGMPNFGDVNAALTLTDHDATNALDENNFEGFNLVANPYSSAIAYAKLIEVNGTAGSGIMNESIWIWDDNGSNTGRGSNADYVTINNLGQVGTASAANSNLWDGNIRSGQGFFVKATAAGSLSFTSAMQVDGNNSDGGFYRSANEAYQTMKFSITSADGQLYSESLIGFANGVSLGKDYLDAQKMSPIGDLKLYSMIDNNPFAIQSIPQGLEEVTIPLGIHAGAEGSFTFAINEFKNWDEGYQVILNDHLTGQSINLSVNSNYSFTASAGTSNRFSLTITKAILGFDQLVSDLSIRPAFNGLGIKFAETTNQPIQLTVSDISGRMLFDQHIQIVGGEQFVNYSFTPNKIYLVRITANGQSFTQKFLIQ